LANRLDLSGRIAQLSDQFKDKRKPIWDATQIFFPEYVRVGGSGGNFGQWLQLLCVRATYEPVLATIQQLGAAFGADNCGHIIGTGSGVVPDCAYYGDMAGENIIISIAGTTNVQQWLSYGIFVNQIACAGCQGLLFEALAKIADLTWPAVQSFLGGWNVNVNVIFVGHSLGGALADIFSRKFQAWKGHWPTATMSFGSPRVGNVEFAGSSQQWYDRVALDGDPVTNIPPFVATRAPYQGVGSNFVRVIPCQYRHSNCMKTLLRGTNSPVRGTAGPKYENLQPMAETWAAWTMDGLSPRHGSAAYSDSLLNWIDDSVKRNYWWAQLESISATIKANTGY